MEELLQQAEILNVNTFMGTGKAIEKSTAYYAWRPVFQELFELDSLSLEAQREQVLARLQAEPGLLRLAPLLNAVLPLELPDNELTAQMSGQVRADNTRQLLVSLLQASVDQLPRLLVFEDAHWLGSASWALLYQVCQEVYPLLLVMATQPLSEPEPTAYRHLLKRPDTRRLQLETLPDEAALQLVCRHLGLAHLPEPVAQLLREKAKGQPLFSQQLAYALRDAGLIKIGQHGQCRLAVEASHLPELELTHTIQSTIASRIDRLSRRQQLTLKTGSVVGPVFTVEMLRDIYPFPVDERCLLDDLKTMAELDLIVPVTPAAYGFKHTTIQEVVYGLIDSSQRWKLHRAVAEWYERNQADGLSPFYPRLAYHWSQAKVSSKAIHYLEKAGEQAMQEDANQEAIRFFGQALSLVQAQPSSESKNPVANPARLQQVCWERQLGEAHYRLGQLAESREHFRQALARLGWLVPTTTGGLTASLLEQLLRQALQQVWPAKFKGDSSKARAGLLEAVRAHLSLAEIAVHTNETMSAINAAIQSLNLAETAGVSAELARAYAGACQMVGLVPLPSLAEAYSRQARKIAQDVDELPTQATVLWLTGIYEMGVGRWASAGKTAEQALEIAHHLGDRHLAATVTTLLANVAYYQGQFARSAKLWADVYATARQCDDIQQQNWGLTWQAINILRLGQAGHTNKAINALKAAAALPAKQMAQADKILTYGLLAVAYLRWGEPQLARQATETAARLIGQSSPSEAYSLEGYAGVAEVYLTLWEVCASSDQLPAKRKMLARSARQAGKALFRFARVFPLGQPRAWLWQGLQDWLAGKPRNAHKAWQKSLAIAEDLTMPYEQGLAHYEIGRHLALDDPARQRHLSRACDIFTELGATYDLARTQTALNSSEPNWGRHANNANFLLLVGSL